MGVDDAAKLSHIALNRTKEIEETIMSMDRRHTWSLVLALVSLAVGLVLFAQGSGLAIRGTFIQLPALLIVYGLVVAWWHTKRAVLVFERCDGNEAVDVFIRKDINIQYP